MVDMTEKDGKLLCAFSGKLDNAACVGFGQRLLDTVASSNLPVVFDMGEVEYASSSFLRLLILVAKKTGRDRLSVIHLSETVRNVFVLSGLDEQLSLS